MAKKCRSSGEGTIVKFKPRNCYRAAINVPQPGGGTKRLYHYGAKKACQEWLTTMRYEIQRGKPVLDAAITLLEWLRSWLERYSINIRDTTRMNYKAYVDKHIARHRIASIPLKNLSTDDLQDFISFLKKSGKLDGSGGLSHKTIRNIMTMIRTALKQAMGNQLIWTNPADYCQLPKVKQTEKQFLTVDEMERLLRAAKGERWYIGLLLLLMTGCRLGELLALRHNSFHCENGLWVLDIHHAVKRVTNFHAKPGEPKTVLEISEPKSDKSYRTIPLLPEVAELVQAHIQMQQAAAASSYGLYQNNPFLVSNELGEVVDPTTFRTWFKGIVEKAEIGHTVRIHDCRGSWASLGLKEGVPLQYLSTMLGHSSQSVTEKYYIHADLEGKCAAMHRLDGFATKIIHNTSVGHHAPPERSDAS